MKTTIFVWLVNAVLVLSVIFVVSCGGTAPEAKPSPAPQASSEKTPEVKVMEWDSPPQMTIDTGKKYTAVIETEKGNLVLELANEGFYDDTTFHRIIPGFMVQGGDPTGTGRGGPGYKFADEFTAHEHEIGTLSMANSGPNTNGSQFFITYAPQHGLDGRHTVFGRLIEGMDVLKNLTPRDPNSNPDFTGDKIIRVVIEES